MENFRIGQTYYCLLKTSIVDEKKPETTDVLYHIGYGALKSKGVMEDPDNTGKLIAFGELAGQRVRISHIFSDHKACMDFAVTQASEQRTRLMVDKADTKQSQ